MDLESPLRTIASPVEAETLRVLAGADTEFSARRELIERLRRQFAERTELAAYLYGSFARREATPDSDIDILVVYPDDATEDEIIDFAHDLSEGVQVWTGNYGHISNASRSWLGDAIARRDATMMSIRQDAVTLVGPEFDQLLRAIGAEKGARA
jgi:predicted nucleotidyltransferase